MFSDETTIKQFESFKTLVCRPPGKCNDMKYAISTVSYSPRVMIWGDITAQGACNLWFLPKKTTIEGKLTYDIEKRSKEAYETQKNEDLSTRRCSAS